MDDDDDDEMARALALSMQQPSNDVPAESPYVDAEVGGPSLALMVFGDKPSHEVVSQWRSQGVTLSTDVDTTNAPGVVPFAAGLAQEHGGPCAILAAAQAFMLRRLLFDPSPAVPQSSPASWLEEAPNDDLSLLPTASEATEALQRGLADILCSCATAPSASDAAGSASEGNVDDCEVVLVAPTSAEELAALEAGLASAASPVEAVRELLRELFQRAVRPRGWLATLNALRDRHAGLQSPIGALCLLTSAVLTRTVARFCGERDDASLPLLDPQFGHCSQEVLNLLLLGCGVSNVFDGSRDLGGGFVLRGVPRRPPVGMLSQLEALRYLQVGTYYKEPRFPIWIVASESHYSILFALTASVQATDELSQLEGRLLEAFSEHDQEGNGFISSEHLETLVRSLPQWVTPPLDELRLQLDPERSSLILWDAFQRVMTPLHPKAAEAAAAGGGGGGGGGAGGDSARRAPHRLYHYNGLAARGHAHKRALRLLEVTPNSAAGQPAFGGGGLASCIATRWKDAAVTYEGPEPSIN